jgi:hypothetical protein
MNELFELLRDLGELAAEIGRVAAGSTARAAWVVIRHLRTAARLAIAWPLALLLVAMPSGKYWPVEYIVPTTSIIILLAALWMATRLEPLAVLTAEALLSPGSSQLGLFVAKARAATNALRIILGLELLTGIYFSVVPIANCKPLALVLVLIVAAAVCFVGTNHWKPVVVALGVMFSIITLMFYLFHWGWATGDLHLGSVFAAHSSSAGTGTDPAAAGAQNPAAGTPQAQPTPAKSARQTDPSQQVDPDAKDPTGAETSNFTGVATHCRTFANSDSPTFQYGDYLAVLQHCQVAGTQLRFSGFIEYRGEGRRPLSFHKIKVSDNAGKPYEVQVGKLGETGDFGTKYASQLIDPGIPIGFSFTAGAVDPKSPPEFLEVVLPNTQPEPGNVTFTGLMER